MEMDLAQFLSVASQGLAVGMVVGLTRSGVLFVCRALFGMSKQVLRQ